jgi:hypothetical protein
LNEEWFNQLQEIEVHRGFGPALVAAAFMAVNNARWLLYRHLEGYRRKQREWPPDWPQWAHAEAGSIQYRNRSKWKHRR